MLLKKVLFFLTIIVFSFHAGYSQDSAAVQWKGVGKKIAAGQYEIQLTGIIKAGWHVYTKPNTAVGLEDFKINFSDSAITTIGTTVVTGNIQTINDKIFGASLDVVEQNLVVTQQIKLAGEVPSRLKATLLYNTANVESFIPEEVKIDIVMEGGVEAAAATNRILIPSIDLEKPVNACGGTGSLSGDLLNIFLLGFLGGLLALVTPCVFPMIPLT
ncbi:MAG TPA: hypothetical protein VHL77_11760, partial [Ferruginibacter sp.]|nr:hypothetical protein [Ferruginibacter sp.]